MINNNIMIYVQSNTQFPNYPNAAVLIFTEKGKVNVNADKYKQQWLGYYLHNIAVLKYWKQNIEQCHLLIDSLL